MAAHNRRYSIIILILAVIIFLFPINIGATTKEAWDSDIKTGDKVCLYDIDKEDPLVDNRSNYSFKYWYRLPAGDQSSVFQLRPEIKSLIFRVLTPGLQISATDRDGNPWYAVNLVVIKGGQIISKDAFKIRLGENDINVEFGRTRIPNWKHLKLSRARLKKKRLGRSCERVYSKF